MRLAMRSLYMRIFLTCCGTLFVALCGFLAISLNVGLERSNKNFKRVFELELQIAEQIRAQVRNDIHIMVALQHLQYTEVDAGGLNVAGFQDDPNPMAGSARLVDRVDLPTAVHLQRIGPGDRPVQIRTLESSPYPSARSAGTAAGRSGSRG